MRTFKNWRTARESIESMCAGRRYSRATELHYFTPEINIVTLGAGTADCIDVFREGERFYVLSTNEALTYVGLQVFEDGEEVAETFIDSAAPNVDYLLELTPIYRAKRIANWIGA